VRTAPSRHSSFLLKHTSINMLICRIEVPKGLDNCDHVEPVRCFPHSKYLIVLGLGEPRGAGNNLSYIQRDISFVYRLSSGSSFLLKHTDFHVLTSWRNSCCGSPAIGWQGKGTRSRQYASRWQISLRSTDATWK
jgi:hypothetical protein